MTDGIIPPTKTCTKCGVEYPTTTEYFAPAKRYKYGLNSQCRKCKHLAITSDAARAYAREKYYAKSGGAPMVRKTVDGERQCRICEQWYPLNADNFHRTIAKGNGGFSYDCVYCAREIHRNYYYEKGGNPLPVIRKDGLKRCSCCEQWFPETKEYFHSHPRHKNGLYPYCRTCSIAKMQVSARARGVKPKEITRNENEKRCPRCQEWKPITAEYYHPNKAAWDGFHNYCIPCAAEIQREEYASKPAVRAQKRKASIQWGLNNPVKLREISRMATSRRRTRQRQQPFDFTLSDWNKCLEWWDNKCAICGNKPDMWHILAQDHFIPVTDNRPDNPGTVAWNIIPVCHARKGSNGLLSCNQTKFNYDPIEWIEAQFGKRKGRQILDKIYEYFEWVKSNR